MVWYYYIVVIRWKLEVDVRLSAVSAWTRCGLLCGCHFFCMMSCHVEVGCAMMSVRFTGNFISFSR